MKIIPYFKGKQIVEFLDRIKKNNFDKDKIEIRFNLDTLNKTLIQLEQHFYNLQNLFLDEGYLYIVELDGYAYFKKEKSGKIYIMACHKDKPYVISFTCNTYTKSFKNCLENEKIIVINNDDVDEKELDLITTVLTETTIAVLSYVNDMVTHQKINIEKKCSKKRITTNNKKKKKKTKEIRNITISEDDIIKRTIYTDKNENDDKREYNRYTESWTRRGHYRHYKSGKVVWIPSKECKAKEPVNNLHSKKNYIIK